MSGLIIPVTFAHSQLLNHVVARTKSYYGQGSKVAISNVVDLIAQYVAFRIWGYF